MTCSLLSPTSRERRDGATVLIVTLLIVVVLTSMVLVFARAMRVEALAAANQLASARARAIALGAAQAVIALGDELPADAVEVGDGAFWLLQPNFEDDRTHAYGIVDESAKINLNSATEEMLLALPGMDEAIVSAIIDWRDEDTEPSAGGAESEYYLMLEDPYIAKDEGFETVEELLLVRDVTAIELYGEDKNRNGVLDPGENDASASDPPDNRDGQLDRGLIDFVTVYSREPGDSRVNVNGGEGGGQGGGGGGGGRGGGQGGGGQGGGDGEEANPDEELLDALREAADEGLLEGDRVEPVFESIVAGRPHRNLIDLYYKSGMTAEEFDAIYPKLSTSEGDQTGLINVNTAPEEVLMAIPGMQENDAQALIAQRLSRGADSLAGSADAEEERSKLAWVTEALERDQAVAIGDYITGLGLQRSVDIVAVSADGRAFERYRMVYDTSGDRPLVLLWQRLTHLGWPLDPEILEKLREGTPVSELVQTTNRGSF